MLKVELWGQWLLEGQLPKLVGSWGPCERGDCSTQIAIKTTGQIEICVKNCVYNIGIYIYIYLCRFHIYLNYFVCHSFLEIAYILKVICTYLSQEYVASPSFQDLKPGKRMTWVGFVFHGFVFLAADFDRQRVQPRFFRRGIF